MTRLPSSTNTLTRTRFNQSFTACFSLLICMIVLTACKRSEYEARKGNIEETVKTLATLETSSEPARQQTMAKLEKLVRDQPVDAAKLLLQSGTEWIQLPDLLASLALAKLREGDLEFADNILEISLELAPHHPLTRGIKGIELGLRGEPGAARAYLESADSWQQPNPWVDHAFGSLLLQSAKTADLARGKRLLKRVVESHHAVLSPAAAFLILFEERVPLLKGEAIECLQLLEATGSLQTDISLDQLRFLAQRLMVVDHALAMRLVPLLWDHPQSTISDKETLARWGLLSEQSKYAEELLQNESERLSPSTRILFELQKWIQEDRFAETIKGLAQNPGLLQTNDIELIFGVLLPNAALGLSEEINLIEHILLKEKTATPLKLRLLQRMVAINPLHQSVWADYGVQNCFKEQPIQTALWLASIGEEEKAIQLLRERPQEDKSILAETEIHISKDAFEQAGRRLADVESTSPEYYYLMARAKQGIGDRQAAENNWENGYKAALETGNFVTLKNLGILAWDFGWDVEARRALLIVYDSGLPMSVPQLLLLQELNLRQKGVQAALRIGKKLHETLPDNTELLNNFAYLSFLEGHVDDTLLNRLEVVVDREPDRLPYRLTLALGKNQAGQRREAMRLLEEVPLEWERLGNRSRLIYTVILKGDQQDVLAGGLAASIDMDELVDEEIKLLDAI